MHSYGKGIEGEASRNLKGGKKAKIGGKGTCSRHPVQYTGKDLYAATYYNNVVVYHNLPGILRICLRPAGTILPIWCWPQAEPSIPFWEGRRKPSLHARMRRGACTVIPSNSRALAPSLTNLRPMCRPYSPNQTTPCNVPYMAVNCSSMRIWWQMNLLGT